MYDRQIKRCRTSSYRPRRLPLFTPEVLSAIARCASTHALVARVLASETPTPGYVPQAPPYGLWVVSKIEDSRTRYVARCWEQFAAHSEDADAALRAAYEARVQMTLVMG